MSEGDRLPCCVPYCRRTTRRGKFTEWICHDHWTTVRGVVRAERNAAKRTLRKVGSRWDHPEGSPAHAAAVEAWAESDRTWEACKAEAIEIAMGIR